MSERASPVRVAQREFDIIVEEPYHWVRLDEPLHDETLVEELDADAVQYAPDEFPGLIYQPPFNEATFVFFVRSGILVDLTSKTAEKAESRIGDLLSILAARGVFDTTRTSEVKDVSRNQLSTEASKPTGEESDVELSISLPDLQQSMVARSLFDPYDRLTLPKSGMTLLFDDFEESDLVSYEYANERGILKATTSPDGTTFAGTDTRNEIGFVFTSERLCYPFECHGDFYCEVANSGAVVVGTGVADATVYVYDEKGQKSSRRTSNRLPA